MRYFEGPLPKSFKLSGVKELLIIALAPDTQESHSNLRIILEHIRPLFNYKLSISADLKMILLLLGKQGGQCKHSCILCPDSKPWVKEGAELLTIRYLREQNRLFKEAVRGKPMDYGNVINKPLIPLPDETVISQVVNPPELHMQSGACVKVATYIEQQVDKVLVDQEGKGRGKQWLGEFLREHQIIRDYQDKFEGNQARLFVQKIALMRPKAIKELPTETAAVVEQAISVLEALDVVVSSCFGVHVQGDWAGAIEKFSELYFALPGISCPPKVHLLVHHVKEFLTERHSTGYPGAGLGFWSEQAMEACHHAFMQEWMLKNVRPENENYSQALFQAVVRFNGKNL